MRFLPEKKKHLVIALALASLALSGMYGLLNLSGVWWRDNRSVNALDELYYATLDSCSEEALSYDLITHDSYLSVVLSGESEPVEAMDGVRNLYSTLSQKPLKHTRSGINDILEATYWGATWYSCDSEIVGSADEVASLEWHLDEPLVWGWDYMNRARPKGTVFGIDFPLSRYHGMKRYPAATVRVEFKYEVEAKRLVIDGNSFYVSRFGSSSDTNNPLGFLKRHGYDAEAIADDAIDTLKGRLLPVFLSRGGAVPRFSPDFEQDGVTVDIDLSSS